MKVVILAGGYGTRISEESAYKPKPMIEIGSMPILWHIMKSYYAFGFDDFIICAGYKQHVIKEWFSEYFLHTSDVTFDFTQSSLDLIIHEKRTEKWRVTVVDTGLDTMTGGRLKRLRNYLNNEAFMMTYGDGVSDIDMRELLRFHKHHGKLATLSAIKPANRFGVLELTDEGQVASFREKNIEDGGYVNAGYMVLEPQVLDYIDDDSTMFEREPLERLVAAGELMCYRHNGFWQCMDTMRDKKYLEELWSSGSAPWKNW